MRGAIIIIFLFFCNSTLQYCSGQIINYSSGVDAEEEMIKRSDFPSDFLFGTSTSAYQIEGGYLEDGKSLSNWDVFTRIPGGVENGDNGDIADDHYHRYMEDIDIMQSLGVNAYRFSISWSRILPKGRAGKVNTKGVEFYNKIIDNLILKGIKPFVTLHHFELPYELEQNYGGWLNPIIQDEFLIFANTCFHSFGNRVKHWSTLNEPTLFSELSYLKGIYPPSHCSPPYGHCSSGNSDLEPLIVIHNMILAHSKATLLYRDHYHSTQQGCIGIITNVFMYEPYNPSSDLEAVERAMKFQIGWVLDPLVYGDGGEYPDEMRRLIGDGMPKFSEEEREIVRRSNGVDFVGVNHYTSLYVKDCLREVCVNESDNRAIKGFVEITGERDGIPIGEKTGMPRFYVVPSGMEKTLDYIRERYPETPIFITENGYGEGKEQQHGDGIEVLNDKARVKYHKSYLSAVGRAMKKGAKVKGYFVWSLMDNFEWLHGYNVRFGLYYVNRTTLTRVPKVSADWYSRFLLDRDDDVVLPLLSED